jgi:hypothetical protein
MVDHSIDAAFSGIWNWDLVGLDQMDKMRARKILGVEYRVRLGLVLRSQGAGRLRAYQRDQIGAFHRILCLLERKYQKD